MAYCVICGSKNDEDARFCVNCGAELDAVVSPEGTESEPETTEKEIIETVVEENGDVIAAETQGKTAAPKKRGRRKSAEPTEEAAAEEAPKEEAKPQAADAAFAVEIVTETEEKEEAQEQQEFSGSVFEEDAQEAREPDAEMEYQPEGIDAYIPPVPKDGADVYRPQYVSSPYSEPTRIGEPININTSVPPVAPPAPGYPPRQPYPPAAVIQTEDKKNKPVSTAGFFWLDILYLFPGVGLIMSVILSFAAGNKNIKNHARAALIIRIVFYVLFAMAVAALIILDHRYGIFYHGRRHWVEAWQGLYN